jgi:hypothetical protein
LAFGPGRPRKTAVAALRPPEKPSPYPIRRHRTTKHGVFQHADKFSEVCMRRAA